MVLLKSSKKKKCYYLMEKKTMSIVTELKIKMLYLFFLGNTIKWMALAMENSRGGNKNV
jgi:hypothetical protein